MSKLLISFQENNYHPDHPNAKLELQRIPNDANTIHFPLKKILFQDGDICIEIINNPTDNNQLLRTSHFIGIDWLTDEQDAAVYVYPKLEDLDYLNMFSSCLKHPIVAKHTKNLYEIKFNEPRIEMEQKDDRLTPLLVVHFLHLLKTIVRKGLKKSYYKVDRNLNSKIKGKVIISQTIKQNLLKNKLLKTFCQYDEFGFNGIENRLLKHTLLYVKKYLSIFPSHSDFSKDATQIFNYCLPAFHEVDEKIEIKSITGIKTNVFYKEYSEAIRLANLILKRFGYDIKNVEGQNNKVKIPPFWIDTAELFERYCEVQLRKIFSTKELRAGYDDKNIKAGFDIRPDFIVNNGLVIDSKYRTIYQKEKVWNDLKIKDDIEQLCMYSRNKEVRSHAKLDENQEPKIVFLYPITKDEIGLEKIRDLDTLKGTEYENEYFYEMFKIPIKLPTVQTIDKLNSV